jgi:serine protease
MGLPNDSGVILPKRQRADVNNLSLGGPGYSQVAQDVYTLVRDRGALIVAPTGNQNSGAPHYPAWCDGVLAVSALDAEKRLAPYSSFGPRSTSPHPAATAARIATAMAPPMEC